MGGSEMQEIMRLPNEIAVMSVLYYYRCSICLSVMTLEEKMSSVKCVCGGRLQYLGPVQHNRWLREEQRPACDGRCINATGPNCDCKCGGKNHGTGLLVTVYYDGGAAVVRPVRAEEALRRAEEYRQAKAAVYQALAEIYGRHWEDYREGRYVQSRAAWEELRFWTREFQRARSLLTHKVRIRRLYDLAGRIRRECRS